MKKTIAMLLAVLVLMSLTACKSGNVASPSPMLTVKPAASPTLGAGTTAPTNPSPSAPASPGTPGGDTIEGFKEGENIEVNALPSTVTEAVSKQYPGATIKSASYATYMDAQRYLITLSGAADNTEKIYVKADGSIVPYTAPTAT